MLNNQTTTNQFGGQRQIVNISNGQTFVVLPQSDHGQTHRETVSHPALAPAHDHSAYFTAQALMDAGVYDFCNEGSMPEQFSAESTINTEILPLFAIDRWAEMPAISCMNWRPNRVQIHEFLKPALRLASLWLTHKAVARYWHTVAFATRKPIINPVDGSSMSYIHHPVRWSSQAADEWRNFLDSQAKYVKIIFAGDSSYGRTSTRRVHPERPYTVSLRYDFHASAVKLSCKGSKPDPNEVLRYHFFFALVLTHEITHFVHMSQYFQPDRKVMYGLNGLTESGDAWETDMFGGVVRTIQDPSYRDRNFDYRWTADRRWGLYVESAGVMYAIPMRYILAVQQDETWRGQNVSHDVLRVALDGPSCSGYPSIRDLYLRGDEEVVRERQLARARICNGRAS